MPFKSVIVKGLGKIKFPASMTDEAIEQSIKNLDMSESARMARAKEQGFDTRRTFYHGTGGDVEGFNPKNLDIKPSSHYYDIGIHGSESPEIANTYAQYSRFPNAAKGMSSGMVGGDPAVYPLLMKASNPLDLTNGVPEDIKSDLIEFAIESGISEKSKYIKLMDSNPNDFMGQLQRKAGREELAEFLNKKGYDGIDYIWQGGKNRVVFDPKNIRSKHAAFNPDLKESPSLLANYAPIALAGPLAAGAMLTGEDAEAGLATGAIKKQLQKLHPDIKFSISGDETIVLDKVIVPDSKRGSGQGTKFMEDFLSLVDKEGKQAALTPTSDFGGNKTRLKKFYKRFGFVDNKGRDKDYSVMEAMIRPSKGVAAVSPLLGGLLGADQAQAATGTITGPKHPKIADLRAFIDEHDDILMDDMLGGLTSYLDKLSYDDKITMKDRILMALDLL